MEWLSESLITIIYRTGGWEGLFLFVAAAFDCIHTLLSARLQRHLAP